MDTFTIEQTDTTSPAAGEVAIYGINTARVKALERFKRNGTSVVHTGKIQIIACYRDAARQNGLISMFTELESSALALEFEVILLQKNTI